MKHFSLSSWRRLGLWLAVLLLLGACQESLFSGLAEAEANEMRQALLKQGIDSTKELADDGKYSLKVRSDDMGVALRTLEAAGLPKQKFANAMDVLKTDALVASPAEDRARLSYAMAQELARTISSIDGVVSARVHLALPERPVLGAGKPMPSSASVFVKYRPGYNLQAATLSIRQLVAKSVEGLTPDQVSVVLVRADTVPLPQPTAEPAPRSGVLVFLWRLLLVVASVGVLAALLRGRGVSLPGLPAGLVRAVRVPGVLQRLRGGLSALRPGRRT